MKALFFRNTKTGKEYRVLAMDRKHNKITLKGEHEPFDEVYTKERFQKMGYELVQRDVEKDET